MQESIMSSSTTIYTSTLDATVIMEMEEMLLRAEKGLLSSSKRQANQLVPRFLTSLSKAFQSSIDVYEIISKYPKAIKILDRMIADPRAECVLFSTFVSSSFLPLAQSCILTLAKCSMAELMHESGENTCSPGQQVMIKWARSRVLMLLRKGSPHGSILSRSDAMSMCQDRVAVHNNGNGHDNSLFQLERAKRKILAQTLNQQFHDLLDLPIGTSPGEIALVQTLFQQYAILAKDFASLSPTEEVSNF